MAVGDAAGPTSQLLLSVLMGVTAAVGYLFRYGIGNPLLE